MLQKVSIRTWYRASGCTTQVEFNPESGLMPIADIYSAVTAAWLIRVQPRFCKLEVSKSPVQMKLSPNPCTQTDKDRMQYI